MIDHDRISAFKFQQDFIQGLSPPLKQPAKLTESRGIPPQAKWGTLDQLKKNTPMVLIVVLL